MKELTLFIPCLLNHFLPETGEKLVKILEKLGYRILISESQSCCGYPFYQDGDKDASKEIAQQFLFDFQTGRRDHKTLICASRCSHMIEKCYPKIFHNSISHNLCQKVLSDVTDLYSLLVLKGVKSIATQPTVLVTDCLSNLEVLGELTNFNDEQNEWHVKNNGFSCCGAGAGLPKHNPSVAEKQMLELFEFAAERQANQLVFTDDLCLMHAKQTKENKGSNIELLHLIDFIYVQLFSNSY